MRRMPEFSAFDSAKSMIRVLPPKYTAGFARVSVSSSSRLPRPPASTNAIVSRASRPRFCTALIGAFGESACDGVGPAPSC